MFPRSKKDILFAQASKQILSAGNNHCVEKTKPQSSFEARTRKAFRTWLLPLITEDQAILLKAYNTYARQSVAYIPVISDRYRNHCKTWKCSKKFCTWALAARGIKWHGPSAIARNSLRGRRWEWAKEKSSYCDAQNMIQLYGVGHSKDGHPWYFQHCRVFDTVGQ